MKRRHLDRTAWHVIMRGARRLLLFRDDADRAAFLRLLGESLKEHDVALHAFVLMGNHFHLLLTSDWKKLGDAMMRLNRTYSRGNNRKYEMKGHCYEGPYLAFPVPTPFWMGRTARYIDFNPPRAGLSRTPEEYKWSSCRTYTLGTASPVPLEMRPVLDAFGSREAYRSYEPPVSRHKRGRTITAMDLWLEQIAWLVEWAQQQESKLDGESPRTIAVAWARESGIPPRAIAKAFGYSDGHSVSVLLDSIRKRAEKEPRLRKILNMIK